MKLQRIADKIRYPNRCKYWRTCKQYSDIQYTCRKGRGYYGDRLASCAVEEMRREMMVEHNKNGHSRKFTELNKRLVNSRE